MNLFSHDGVITASQRLWRRWQIKIGRDGYETPVVTADVCSEFWHYSEQTIKKNYTFYMQNHMTETENNKKNPLATTTASN